MESLIAPARLFPLVGAAHPFAERIRRFAELVAERQEASGAPDLVHAEIKALPEGNGGWRLDRFYWSGQRWRGAGVFEAETLAYRDGQGAAWHAFPHDPHLGDAGAALAACRLERVEILRYVPLRRLTFRATYEGAPVVGKFKRRSRFREADDRLAAVAAAGGALAGELRVSRPAGVFPEHGLTLQEALPGRNLAGLIDSVSGPALLRRLGEVHGALHELHVTGVPEWDPDAYRAGVARSIGWVAFMRPELGGELSQIGALLESTAPDLRAGWRFGHGDFVPSQVLVGGGLWGVIDFDLCRVGDPYQELAALLAALPYDVPALRGAADQELARDSYLAGYAARTGAPLDMRRLSWHRVCAELTYLGLGLKKDWLDEDGLAAAADRLRACAAELRRGGAQ